jgi:hypothetical protein
MHRCFWMNQDFHFIFCWPCISSQILVNNQPDALFRVFIYSFHPSTCFEHHVLIIRRSNCINTSSGIISLCKWLLGMPAKRVPSWQAYQAVTQTNHTRWCINTIRSPDDEHSMLETCREMKLINNSVAYVRERTIPTERPPLVGEVSANFCG